MPIRNRVRWTGAGWGRVRLAILLATLVSALSPAASLEAQTSLRFSLDWRIEGPAAPFLLALDRGYFQAEGLEVTIEPGMGAREPIARLASGAYDIALGDVNTLVRYRDENAGSDIKAVMMLHDRPSFAIVGRKSRGVSTELSSLRRKRFGAPSASATYAQWPVFRALHRIEEAEWEMTFENVGIPVREGMLAQGEVDAVFGRAVTSAVNLTARGVPADDVVVLLMSHYGLELYGNAILVTQRFAAEKPEAVRGFLRALVKGVRAAQADPPEAVEAVLRRNELARREVEEERLRMALDQNMITPWVRENGIGGIDRARFERALDQIGLGTSYKRRPKLEEIFVESFLPPAHERRVD